MRRMIMAEFEKKIIAVIVTFNRVDMLKDAIVSIEEQTYPVEQIIIVDNASSDGTKKYIESISMGKKNILYHRLLKNTGGAGGFNFGMKKAFSYGPDFIWLIDDDTYSDKKALEALIKVAEKYPGSFYCSYVTGKDGLPMNLPDIDSRGGENGYPTWNQYLAERIIKVRACTFVSVIIPLKEIKRAGFPIREMFIWGDDGEYTHRLSSIMNGYLVGDSIVEHRRLVQKKIEIFNETDQKRIRNFFYFYRNNLYLSLKYKTRAVQITFVAYALIDSIRCLLNGRTNTFKIILNGLIMGFFFNPAIEYVSDDSKPLPAKEK